MTSYEAALWRTIHACITAAGSIKQKTLGWNIKKIGVVGGSQVAAVIGKNPFKGPVGVVREKVAMAEAGGLQPIISAGNEIKMSWGNLFESVLREFIEVD